MAEIKTITMAGNILYKVRGLKILDDVFEPRCTSVTVRVLDCKLDSKDFEVLVPDEFGKQLRLGDTLSLNVCGELLAGEGVKL